MAFPNVLLSLLVVSLVHLKANAQGGQLSQVISESYVRFSECSTFLETCQPTVADCATYICAQCTSVGSPAINRCCAESDPLSCFIAGAGGVKSAAATTTTDVSGASSTLMPGSASTTDGSAAATTTASTVTVPASTSASASASSNIASTNNQGWSIMNSIAGAAAMLCLLFGYAIMA